MLPKPLSYATSPLCAPPPSPTHTHTQTHCYPLPHFSTILTQLSFTALYCTVGGRILRTDYADPTRRQKADDVSVPSTAAPESPSWSAVPSTPPKSQPGTEWKLGYKNPVAVASLTGKEKSPGKITKGSSAAVSASEGVAVTKKIASSTVAGTGTGTSAGVAAVAASSSSWSSSVSGTGGGIVKLPASKLMGLKIPDKSAAKEGIFRDRGETSKPPQEGEDVINIGWMDEY